MLWDGNARAAASAQLLQRSARTFGLNAVIQYVPHGPLLDWRNTALAQTVLADLRTAGKQANAIFIKIDPALAVTAPGADASTTAAADLLARSGWKLSASQIQFRNTVVLDLQQPLEKLLADFKPKTRYNIRLAQRHGVQVQPATAQQLPALYDLYKQTAQRDGFPIRPQAYYLDLWSSFAQAGLAQPMIAEYGAQPIAGAVVFAYAQQAVYMHGMSASTHRDKMPNDLLQWHALQWALACGARAQPGRAAGRTHGHGGNRAAAAGPAAVWRQPALCGSRGNCRARAARQQSGGGAVDSKCCRRNAAADRCRCERHHYGFSAALTENFEQLIPGDQGRS